MKRQSDLNDIYGVRHPGADPLEKGSEAPETGFRHSDAYHRYFRGYTEIRRKKPNGGYSVERYYTRPWIVRAASAQTYWLTRLGYAFLAALSWGLYVWTMCQDLGSNRAWFVAVPGLPAVILLVLLTAATVGYLFVPRKMTVWDHASSTGRLKRASLGTAACMLLVAAAKAVFVVRYGGDIGAELMSMAVTLLSSASAAAIFLLERKAVYTTVPNDTVLPEGEAYEIW